MLSNSMKSEMKDGVNRQIKYIRRMAKLPDEQLRILLKVKIDSDPSFYQPMGIDIEGHIKWIRNLNQLTDEGIKLSLNAHKDDPIFQEIYTDASKKKAIKEITEAAKDIHSDPRIFARKVA